MNKTAAVIIFVLSIPLAAGLGWAFGIMFPRFGAELSGWLGGVVAVPFTAFAVTLAMASAK